MRAGVCVARRGGGDGEGVGRRNWGAGRGQRLVGRWCRFGHLLGDDGGDRASRGSGMGGGRTVVGGGEGGSLRASWSDGV